jgi:hypothetical protein
MNFTLGFVFILIKIRNAKQMFTEEYKSRTSKPRFAFDYCNHRQQVKQRANTKNKKSQGKNLKQKQMLRGGY